MTTHSIITKPAREQMAAKEALLSADEARALFHYDEDAGTLTRKVTVSHKAKAGDIVGYPTTNGYTRVKVHGKHYRVHRVAFLIKEGRWPTEIDHKNRDKQCNAWCNIHEVTRATNQANRRLKAPAAGYVGVYAAGKKFMAQFQHEGTRVTVCGLECPAEAAIAYRVLADLLATPVALAA